MTISSELFIAILAMDAYNRGYNAGIVPQGGNAALGLGGVGSQIGNATVTRQDGGTDAQAASFFAQSYSWNGQTVISYRGTDNLPSVLGGKGDWRDVAQWRQMVGSFDTPQQKLAA